MRRIARSFLTALFKKSRLGSPDLVGIAPPHMTFEAIKCVHGKHRIAAAKEVLLVGNKWWVVDLYAEGMCFETDSSTNFLLVICRS